MIQLTNTTNTTNIQDNLQLLTDEDGLGFDVSKFVVSFFEWAFALLILVLLGFVIRRQYKIGGPEVPLNPEIEARRKERQEAEAQRKRFILKLFKTEHIQQKIKGDQIKHNESGSESFTADCHLSHDTLFYDEDEEDHGMVVISEMPVLEESPDEESQRDKTERSVANLCMICLDEYHAGETIVWSSNKKCSHAFHQDCLANYLVKLEEKNTYPCPCCRQNFFYEEDKCKTVCDEV